MPGTVAILPRQAYTGIQLRLCAKQYPIYKEETIKSNHVPDNIPQEYRPISMWGYFGYELLFSIPCVGFILLIVFSVGGTKNVNLRNFARSYFCFMILAFVLILILVIFGAAGAGAASVMGSM